MSKLSSRGDSCQNQYQPNNYPANSISLNTLLPVDDPACSLSIATLVAGLSIFPHLSDADEAILWRENNTAHYGTLDDLARGCDELSKIESHWDEIGRMAGSLRLGVIHASELIRSLLRSRRLSGLAQAIMEVGQVKKTLYLLNYIDDEDYLRRILTQLNRGEERRAVARAICYGQRSEIRKRHREGLDFMHNALVCGRRIRTFNVVDDFNREALAIEIDLNIPALRVVRVLDRIVANRGYPLKMRMDNGPELISLTLAQWAEEHDVVLDFIKPGKPTQNAFIERFTGRTEQNYWVFICS